MSIKISSKYNPGCNLLVATPKLATHAWGEGAQQSSVLQYDFLPVVLSAGAIQEGGFWAKSSLAFHYNLPPPLLTTMLRSSHKT